MATVKSYEIDNDTFRNERKSLYILLEEQGIKIPERNGRNHREYVEVLGELLLAALKEGDNEPR